MFCQKGEGWRLHLDLAVSEIVQHGLDLHLLIPEHGEGQLNIHKEQFPNHQLKGI